MNKAQIEGQWGFARLVYGNARRQIERIPDDQLGFRPTADIRTIGELAVHMHQYLTELTEAVLTGQHVAADEPKFATKAALLNWADAQVAKGFENLGKITEAQLSQVIDAWGTKFPGWQLLSFVPTEVVHHRGQLMTYLRLLGVEPVFAYDFEPTAETGK